MAKSDPVVYLAGHVKRNPDTDEVALRTIFPEDQGPQMAQMAWLVATKNVGARNAPTSEIGSWVDVYTPPAPVVEIVPPPPIPGPTGE